MWPEGEITDGDMVCTALTANPPSPFLLSIFSPFVVPFLQNEHNATQFDHVVL
jgi:hypothetical protein